MAESKVVEIEVGGRRHQELCDAAAGIKDVEDQCVDASMVETVSVLEMRGWLARRATVSN